VAFTPEQMRTENEQKEWWVPENGGQSSRVAHDAKGFFGREAYN
jgi:hypothetical protein